ncbi:hypothetical protein D920_02047 [Enterococcus faecalis 13-SD-W-01]|nr:hypothetical protein D920_02047 [Enterococcus faecalis 13-SD-W-01]
MNLTTSEIHLANNINSSIQKQEINKKIMAEAINITPQLLSHITNGRRTTTLRNVVSIGEYLSDPEFDFTSSAALFGTPKPLKRNRRDNHPLSILVGQNKEEAQRQELEKRFDIWDILPIECDEISAEELSNIHQWLFELIDEIASELAVFITVCDRYGLDTRKIITIAQARERND